ncbi:MAG: M24 family metallopeptidase, partial [Deltaproteobacteria bacterium]|nr:M24 family metallopeptidase [Deltaproteobacteria bacterium]
GNLDPLRLDLGSNTGIFIFTDRKENRVERAVLGRASTSARTCGAYDIFGRVSDLKRFVSERDPKRIAVNFSETIAVCDGISHTDYLKLVDILGDKYAKRIVSAENVITDFRTRRVMSEIVYFGELCKETLEVMDRAFDIVEPGKTTVLDIGRWLVNQNMLRGFDSMFQFLIPGVFIQDRDGHENDARGGDDYVIQRGDLIHIDFGTIHMNFRTDIKRLTYVLKEGETTLPSEIQKTFDEALRGRELFRKNIKVGRTAGETFEMLKEKLEEAGFYYNTKGQFDTSANPEKTQINFYFHPLGNSWPVDGVGPSIIRNSDTAHLKMDDVVVTGRGVEFLYPPMKQIRLIHK